MNYVSLTHRMRNLPLVFVFLISCSNSTSLNDKNLKNSKFQTVLDNELTENIPGILVNITSLDKNIQWSGASGLSDKDNGTVLLPNQTFRIASVTKTFVAATILRLWEDRKLGLDDVITKYISDEHADVLEKGGYTPDKITIRHLLTHSSGLSEHTNSYKFKTDYLKTHHVWTRTEQVNDLVTYAKPVGVIGEQFSYSDTGYILLGEIIEKITGVSMGNAILELLQLVNQGMTDTYMEDFDGDFSGKRIHQYYENVDTYNFHPSMDYYGGGGLLSTTKDLGRFYQLLFHHKIFRYKSTLDTMLAPLNYKTEQALDYRMGIWKTMINGMECYTHTGFWGTQVVYIPKINTAISVNYSQRWANKGNAPVIPKILTALVQNH